MTGPGAVVAYIRVSTAGQAADGYGLDAQRQACTDWAARSGAIIVAEYADEGLSGTLPAHDRPGLSGALAHLSPDVGLLVPRLDRLARELGIQEAALATAWGTGARVFAADGGEVLRDDPDDPMRTLLRQMVGAIAQFDRSLTVKRMRDGRRVKAARGMHAVGSYGFGYAGGGEGRDRDAVPLPEEQITVRRILALRAAGHSLRAIAAQLDREGLCTRSGRPWAATTVRAVIVREHRRQAA